LPEVRAIVGSFGRVRADVPVAQSARPVVLRNSGSDPARGAPQGVAVGDFPPDMVVGRGRRVSRYPAGRARYDPVSDGALVLLSGATEEQLALV
jgi:hypothetical protein